MVKIVCKICIMQRGLKGSDVIEDKCDYAFDTQEELFEHAEKVHKIKINREKDRISVRKIE